MDIQRQGGGTRYFELKQDGETVTSIGRGFISPGLTGTLHNGKLHLEGASGRPGGDQTKIEYDAPKVAGDSFTIRGPNPNGEIDNATFIRSRANGTIPTCLKWVAKSTMPAV